MSHFAGPMPTDPEKPHFLHDQEALPNAPTRTYQDYARVFLGLGLGIVFGLLLVALAFEARASWGSHRDWVVPTTIPLLVLAGVALGYLAARLRWTDLAPGLGFLGLAIGLTVINLWRGAITEGDDTFRDILSILTGIALGLTVIALVFAYIRMEVNDPLRPPAQEM